MNHPGIPKKFVLEFQKNFGSSTFVETGTFQGTTALWASQHFCRVVSIEASAKLHNAASLRLQDQNNVELVLGSSDSVLPQLVNSFDGSTVFWLDGHWSGGETYGAQYECPILGELSAIRSLENQNLILIDDASYFLAPPPHPHRQDQWPSIKDLLDCLQCFTIPQHLFVFENTIIVAPLVTKDWLGRQIQDLRISATTSQSIVQKVLRRLFCVGSY